MQLLIFGHAGARVLVFPTSMGSVHEWAERRMPEVLGDHLTNGWIQMFCLDHVQGESWYAEPLHPGARAWRHRQYDRYLTSELLPFTAYCNPNPFVIALGASFGAYQAACLGLRHPDLAALAAWRQVRSGVLEQRQEVQVDEPHRCRRDPHRLVVLDDAVRARGRAVQ